MDQLEELIEEKSLFHLFGRAYGVNLDKFNLLINTIRVSLPDEIRKAQQVSANADKIVAEARQRAEQVNAEVERILEEARRRGSQLLDEADAKAKELVAQSEVMTQAQDESKRMLEEAKRRAEEIRTGAEQYAMEVFDKLETYLNRVLEVIEKGRRELKG